MIGWECGSECISVSVIVSEYVCVVLCECVCVWVSICVNVFFCMRVCLCVCVCVCKDKRCKTCPNLDNSKKIQSNITHRKYQVINPTGVNLNCHSQNVIYLLTCLSCNVQYVGETGQRFNLRMNGHRTAKTGCEHEINHCKEACDGYNFKYQIIENG